MGLLMMELNRGDIYLINFNPTKGSEIGKYRPAIILSGEQENKILDTVIVIPLSTVIEPNSTPYRFHITARDKLKQNSDACIYEIRSLSKVRIKEKLSSLNNNEIKSIIKYLCEIVG